MGCTQGHTGILSIIKSESRETFVMPEDTLGTQRSNFCHLVNLDVFTIQGFEEIVLFTLARGLVGFCCFSYLVMLTHFPLEKCPLHRPPTPTNSVYTALSAPGRADPSDLATPLREAHVLLCVPLFFYRWGPDGDMAAAIKRRAAETTLPPGWAGKAGPLGTRGGQVRLGAGWASLMTTGPPRGFLPTLIHTHTCPNMPRTAGA